MADRQLNHYSVFAFTDSFWQQASGSRQSFLQQMADQIPELADRVFLYNLFPTRADGDLLIWSALDVEDNQTAGGFLHRFAATSASWRHYLKPINTLWGFTRPSVYASGKSSQELNPLQSERGSYLIVYPFTKTAEWYLMSREDRQGMMNEHIRVGRQYTDITQLLLYSTGLQDQEFVVVYETEDLPRFSALVSELRSTEGRKYTLSDTPIYSAAYAPPEQALSAWSKRLGDPAG